MCQSCTCNTKQKLRIKIKYFHEDLERIQQIKLGTRIDLRCAIPEGIKYKAGDFFKIPLGIAMEMPEMYEAEISSRSSTFEVWGLLQTNAPGIVDDSYKGDNDEWKFAVYATKDGEVKFNERICQFRIQEKNA